MYQDKKPKPFCTNIRLDLNLLLENDTKVLESKRVSELDDIVETINNKRKLRMK